jgi:hypothetical protein
MIRDLSSVFSSISPLSGFFITTQYICKALGPEKKLLQVYKAIPWSSLLERDPFKDRPRTIPSPPEI